MCGTSYICAALFSSGDLERLTKEISTMLSFRHPNVMSLVGVCLDGEMPLLIMPFMSNGSVLEYVRRHKQELLLTSEATDEEVWFDLTDLDILPCPFLAGTISKEDISEDVSPNNKGNGISCQGKVCSS